MGVNARGYDSSGRQAQTRAARAAVVAAAHDLFVERGYMATTIEAVGRAAGVPLATVYRLLGSKRDILAAVLDVSFVGDDEALALHQRPAVAAAFAEEDPHRLVAAFAGVCRQVFDRSAPIQRVLRGAADADPAAAELLDRLNRQRLDGQTRVARALADREALASGVTADGAADTIYALMAPELHHLLTVDRGWDSGRYERWLSETLDAVLLRPSPSATGGSSSAGPAGFGAP